MEYIQPMNDVAEDFVKHLRRLLTSTSTIVNLEMEIFKWALECKLLMIIICLYVHVKSLEPVWLTFLGGSDSNHEWGVQECR